MTNTVEIPVIDVGPYFDGVPGALEKAAAELRWASENIGFYYIKGHGVPQSMIDATFAAAKQFGDLPLEDKMSVLRNETGKGYMPIKSSTSRKTALSSDHKPNQNEALGFGMAYDESHPKFGTAFYNKNRFPPNAPGLEESCMAYCNTMLMLMRRLLPIYATALDPPPDFFADKFREPASGMRLNHYPPVSYEENEYGIAPHTDSTFITILAQNKVGGLQIRTQEEEWIDAPVIAGTFIINTGDILNRWSNERFLSTPHRAINRTPGVSRYAIPFFGHPDRDAVLEPLPTCVSADNPPKYPSQTTADFLADFAAGIYANKTPAEQAALERRQAAEAAAAV